MESVSESKGSSFYENWKASLAGGERKSTFDYPLFTDAHIIDELTHDCGPYQFLNAVPRPDTQIRSPSIFLRVEYYLENELESDWKTNVDRYHGGFLQDEAAALISLCLSIKLKAGEFIHLYESGKDARGRPVSWGSHKDPVLFKPPGQPPVLPRTLGDHDLKKALRIRSVPDLIREDSLALIRSARLYQDALWIAESWPELSWLLLVSAIETAAQHWNKKKASAVERMKAFKPELVALLDGAGGPNLIQRVAELIADYMGATKKFTEFLLHFMPDEPPDRPGTFAQHPWNVESMKRSFKKIYDWRSRALHGGIPFPAPMCEPPTEFYGGLNEKPLGLAASSKGGVWAIDDIPMLLHVFEYIVNGTLINWWESMLQSMDQLETHNSSA